MTGRALAKLLGPLGIHPCSAGSLRGYRADAFDDAIARYLPLKASKRQNTNKDGPETPILTRRGDETSDASKTMGSPTKTGLFDGLTPEAQDLGTVAEVRRKANVGTASAQIPFMITRKTEAELRQLGYPQTAMDRMTPGEALNRAHDGIAYDLASGEDAEERAAIQAEGDDVAKF